MKTTETDKLRIKSEDIATAIAKGYFDSPIREEMAVGLFRPDGTLKAVLHQSADISEWHALYNDGSETIVRPVRLQTNDTVEPGCKCTLHIVASKEPPSDA